MLPQRPMARSPCSGPPVRIDRGRPCKLRHTRNHSPPPLLHHLSYSPKSCHLRQVVNLLRRLVPLLRPHIKFAVAGMFDQDVLFTDLLVQGYDAGNTAGYAVVALSLMIALASPEAWSSVRASHRAHRHFETWKPESCIFLSQRIKTQMHSRYTYSDIGDGGDSILCYCVQFTREIYVHFFTLSIPFFM